MTAEEKQESQFPDWYTIDEMGLDSLCYFLKKEYAGKTVNIIVQEELPSLARGNTRNHDVAVI